MAFQLFTYGQDRLAGIRSVDTSFDLAKAATIAALPELVGADVDALIGKWDIASNALAQLDTQMTGDPARFAAAALEEDSLDLHAPLQRPGTIYAAGANYRDHVEAMGRASGRKLVLDPKAQQIPPWHFIKAVVPHFPGTAVAWPTRW